MAGEHEGRRSDERRNRRSEVTLAGGDPIRGDHGTTSEGARRPVPPRAGPGRRALAAWPAYATVVAAMNANLHAICDPAAMDREAKRDQAVLVEQLGGPEAVLQMDKVVVGG